MAGAGSVDASIDYVRTRLPESPEVGIILGTGLGNAIASLDQQQTISYRDIPGFPQSTALSHRGELGYGMLAGSRVAVMLGRCHFYEGYSWDEITLPIRMLAALGIRRLIVTNASGGLNPLFHSGQLMIIADHINWMFRGPRGGSPAAAERSVEPVVANRGWPRNQTHTGRTSSRACYDERLMELALLAARQADLDVVRGVYLAVTGPNYETRSEYRLFRRLGADAVGMSTVPEVLAAQQLGLGVLGLSMITNVARPDAPEKVDAQEVVDIAAAAGAQLGPVIEGVISSMRTLA